VFALVAALGFLGYTLVYAAVANGGKLASRPWDALREDAYTGGSPHASSSSHPSVGSQIAKGAETLIPGGTVIGPIIGSIIGGHHGTVPKQDQHAQVHREVK
jgi:hypothetical protein